MTLMTFNDPNCPKLRLFLPAALLTEHSSGISLTQGPILVFFVPQGYTLHRWGEIWRGGVYLPHQIKMFVLQSQFRAERIKFFDKS